MGAGLYLPQEWRHQRFAIFEMHENGKLGSFRTERCQKYQLYQKMLQLKVIKN